jgi:hypothetical protein
MSQPSVLRNARFPLALRSPSAGLFSVLLLTGCALGGSSNPFVETSNTEAYLLRVESRNSFEVSVYIIPAGRRQLVGTVPGNGLEYFEFEYPAGRPLSVELEGRMGDRYRIPSILFPGGGRVDLLVYDDLRRSGFVRRAPL